MGRCGVERVSGWVVGDTLGAGRVGERLGIIESVVDGKGEGLWDERDGHGGGGGG
jgi:hypothetical protein